LPGSLARQPCQAALPGSLARQPCQAALPGSLALQPCRKVCKLFYVRTLACMQHCILLLKFLKSWNMLVKVLERIQSKSDFFKKSKNSIFGQFLPILATFYKVKITF
jgi:hypothetical protein